MVVEQHLAVATAGRLRPAAVVAHRDDRRDAPRTLGSRGSEGHELRAGPAGEVVEVHSDEGAPVVGPDRGTHGVDAVLVESRIGVGVNAAPGQLDQLELASVELTRGAQQGVHRHSMSNNHHGVRGTHTMRVKRVGGRSLLAGFGPQQAVA